MAFCHLTVLAKRGEPLASVLANRLEQAEPRLLPANEALVDEGLEAEHDVRTQHLLGVFERPPACEHGQARKERPLTIGEQRVTPVQRGSKRSLPRRKVARAFDEEVECACEALRDRPGRQDLYSCRGKLDCERKPVESAADRSHAFDVVVGEGERRIDGLRACGEQPHRLVRHELLEGQTLPGCRQRRHRILVLPREAQRDAARSEHPQARRSTEELRDGIRRRAELLEVVENEQRRPVAQMLEDIYAGCNAECLADRRQHELGIFDR